MTEHVPRVDQLVMIERLNEFERVVPIYRHALERIAGQHTADPHREAHEALHQADHPPLPPRRTT